jgi:hypothetical protein
VLLADRHDPFVGLQDLVEIAHGPVWDMVAMQFAPQL